ncbi:hypothetical protein JZ751_007105 [Albula glossodonta]|uniref:Putative adherens-junction anchoring domain-containing protein n=1 Tax=Albula glossodonta TaxID=121402 RepID=A0A8T2P513_9TELE|nr:hypothetical protein JZ751_007105 [Albula glossodonta]
MNGAELGLVKEKQSVTATLGSNPFRALRCGTHYVNKQHHRRTSETSISPPGSSIGSPSRVICVSSTSAPPPPGWLSLVSHGQHRHVVESAFLLLRRAQGHMPRLLHTASRDRWSEISKDQENVEKLGARAKVENEILNYKDLAALPKVKAIYDVQRPELMSYEAYSRYTSDDRLERYSYGEVLRHWYYSHPVCACDPALASA